ncbi:MULTISPECIES: hypothetical protein [unclassified Streptomyces]|uniref:hypothetical protein n=1 Tax=unclassified Streptomyces TaxID=2593676 RepID=UPI0032515705
MTEQLAAGDEDFVRPTPAGRGVAWDDPGTRRAWWRQTGRSLLLVATCAAWWTWYAGITIPVRERVVWLNVAFFLYSLFGLPLQLLAELPNGWRVRRVLRAHPWHIAENPPHGISDHPKARDVSDAWFEVPDPADPESRLPLIISAPLWWTRRMRAGAPAGRRARIARLWYCGVPGDEVVIAASRSTETAPRRLRHRYLRYGLMPESPARTDAAAPHPSRSALSHPATGRAMRRRLFTLVAALLLVWPTVLFLQIAEVVADEDHDKIGLFGLALLCELTLLPLHIFLIVATRRMRRTLATNTWRLVDCEIRRRGKQQLIRLGDVTLTTPPSSSADSRLTQLWIAGHPRRHCVISAPGGARPLRVAMSTTDNRNP